MPPPPKKPRDDGYVLVHAPEHPSADADGYVLEHRFVMEAYLGERLLPSEVVHHRDRRRWNNEFENLLLCPAKAAHDALHEAMRKGDARVLEVLESWLRTLASERRQRVLRERKVPMSSPAQATLHEPDKQPKSPPRTESPPRAFATVEPEVLVLRSEADAQLANVVDTICAIPHKQERRAYLEQLLECVDRAVLARAIVDHLDLKNAVVAQRIVWTLGELDIEEAGPVFTAVLRCTDERPVRRLVYSALTKRRYDHLDTDHLAAVAITERGQALQYAVGAVAMNCEPTQALTVIEAIAAIAEPEYDQAALDTTLNWHRRRLHGRLKRQHRRGGARGE